MLTLAGQPSPDAAAKEIFALETRLARAHWTNVESRDAVKTYNKVTFADLPKQFPGFDWDAWAQELGVGDVNAVVVGQPSYFKAMAAAIDELPVDRWKPYLKFHTVNGFAPYLSKAFVEAAFDFYGRTLRGVKEKQPRWKRAVNNLNGNLGEMLGKLYVEQHFKPEAKARMERLVENLRAAFREGIDKLEWMGPETKKEAQEKLAEFRPKIGYPNKWRDYSKVEIKPDDLVGNMMRAWMAESDLPARQGGQADRSRGMGHDAADGQRVLQPGPQRDRLPRRDPAAAVLRSWPQTTRRTTAASAASSATRWATASTTRGAASTRTASLRDWWTAKDAEEFTKRAKVLVEQYSTIEPLPGLNVNGELTLGENIGDLTGVTISHRAYQLSLDGKEPPVDRRHHRRSALLLRLGAGVAGEVARRRAAPAGADQPARAGHDAGQRPAAERRRVLQHVRREGRRQDVAAAGSTGQDLVMSYFGLCAGLLPRGSDASCRSLTRCARVSTSVNRPEA